MMMYVGSADSLMFGEKTELVLNGGSVVMVGSIVEQCKVFYFNGLYRDTSTAEIYSSGVVGSVRSL